MINVTAAVFGDPPPGRSAQDGYVHKGTAARGPRTWDGFEP